MVDDSNDNDSNNDDAKNREDMNEENKSEQDDKSEQDNSDYNTKKYIKIIVLIAIVSFIGIGSGFVIQSVDLLSSERDLVDRDEFDFPNGTSPNGINSTAGVGLGHLNTLASGSFTFKSSGKTNNQTQNEVLYKYNNTQSRGVEYQNHSSETPLGYQDFSENKSHIFDTTNQTIQTSQINGSEFPITGWRETTGIIENLELAAVRTYTINDNESVVVYEVTDGASSPKNSTITKAEGEIHISENVYYKYVDVNIEQQAQNTTLSIQTQRNITDFKSTTVGIPSWFSSNSGK